ncbi:MAG: acyl-CoA dehydrogenase [Nitrospinota bacterium]|nr:MAG: acyl-CoA dehydrogenase [Nitrospinota bacterium]
MEVTDMEFRVPDEIKELKKVVRRFVEEELRPLEREVEEKGVSPELRKALTKKAVDLGIYALAMPKEYGGGGLGLLGQVMIAEEMGRIHPSLRFVVSDGDQMVLHWGTEEQKQRYLVPVIRGEKIPAIGMTEPDAGSDISMIKTTAVRDGDHWILNGTKHFTTYADIADYIKVFAVTDKSKGARGGITCFLVDTDTPGFRVTKVFDSIARSLHVCEEVFENCIVPHENVLGGVGQGHKVFGTTYAMNRGRYGGFCVGIAEYLLEKCRDYAKQRVLFGEPIANRQAIQWMLADTAIDIYATRMMTYNFAWRYDQGMDVRHESSMVKTFAVEMVGRAADRAIQIHGGMGLMKDLPFERIYREVRALRIAGGTTEIQRMIIARNILRGHVSTGYNI